MSGVFGITRLLGKPVGEAEMACMADALKHRGPDGLGYKIWDNAGLGHAMLHTTPESLTESLPLQDPSSGLVITADARIDNREKLVADMALQPVGSETISDSELILKAYLKWGEACVDHLLGDFVFAIWDERNQSLFVARDHMGCKPLYYYRGNGLFVFASSAMAIARVSAVQATINEARVADYMVQELEGINKSCTWYNEIFRLPPACCGLHTQQGFRSRQYWVLKPADVSHLNSDEDCLRAFTEVYTEAVRARLRCQVQPASMLSGGLDSSSIVALASGLLADAGKPPLRTYSAISELGVPCPETRSIEAVASHGGVIPTVLKPSDCEHYSKELTRTMAVMEDPFDGSWSLLRLMFLSAAQGGSRVLLGGLDGEHAVGAPTNYLTFLLRGGHWLTAWREARGFSRHYWRGHHSALKLYGLAVRGFLVPGFLRRLKRRLMRAQRYRQLVKGQVIAADLCRRVDLPSRVVEYDHSMQLDLSEGLLAWHLHILQVPYLTAAIERYERLGSYFGLETRHPLLDIRLLELSVALPLDQKVRGGWSKYLLRRISQQRLPYSVAWREGWEELGWSFTLRQAQKLGTMSDLSLEDLQQTLAPYTDRHSLAQCCRAGFEGEEEQLVEYWQQYLLCQWLQREVIE